MLLTCGWLLFSLFSLISFLKVTLESGGSLWAECVLVVAACPSFLSFIKILTTLMDCEKWDKGAGCFGFMNNTCSPNIMNLLSGEFSTRNMFSWWQPALLSQYCDFLMYSQFFRKSFGSYARTLCIFRSAVFTVLRIQSLTTWWEKSCTYVLFPCSRECEVASPGTTWGTIYYKDVIVQVRCLTNCYHCNFSSGHNSNCKPLQGSEDFMLFLPVGVAIQLPWSL